MIGLPRHLLKESLGEIDASGEFLNVSDGGHLENLGVYELLQRRCKLIIAVDGGADPELKCSDLTKIIRYARIDMGVEITFEKDELEALNLAEGGFSTGHWALGKIDYGKDGVGYLLYLKSSVTGDENPYVLDYKAQQPAFPHQSTADQFLTRPSLRHTGHSVTTSPTVFSNRQGQHGQGMSLSCLSVRHAEGSFTAVRIVLHGSCDMNPIRC